MARMFVPNLAICNKDNNNMPNCTIILPSRLQILPVFTKINPQKIAKFWHRGKNWLNLVTENSLSVGESASVTWFGEILLLWQNLKSSRRFFCISHTFKPFLAQIVWHWADFCWCRLPKIVKESSYPVTLRDFVKMVFIMPKWNVPRDHFEDDRRLWRDAYADVTTCQG